MNDLLIKLAVAIYNATAMSVTMYLVIVITQAQNDLHLKRTDRPALRYQRKKAFYGAAAFLLLTMCFQKYWLLNPSIISVAIVVTGYLFGAIWILAVNSSTLREREPPNFQRGHGNFGYRVLTRGSVPIRNLIALFRHSKRSTLE